MGAKGSSAAAPDPRLIEAQIKSMGIQDDAIGRVLQNSNELAPLQKEQLQFGIKANNTAYEQSQDDRKFALGKRDLLSGIQNGMVDEAKAFSTADRQNELAGKAISDVTQSIDGAQAQQDMDLARAGVDPASGRALAIRSATGMSGALAKAQAGTMARTQARVEGRALTDRASNALAGYPAMSMQTTGSGAGFGSSGINIANTGANGMNSGFSTAGNMAGQMGSNASNMYGTMGNYKNNADSAEGQGFGAVVGAGATVAAAAF